MECYKEYAASAMAALVVFRSLFGAGLPIAVDPMVRAVSRCFFSDQTSHSGSWLIIRLFFSMTDTRDAFDVLPSFVLAHTCPRRAACLTK